MRLRIITAVFGIPLLLGIVLSGAWILKLAIGVMVLVGLYEFYSAMEKKVNPIKYVGIFYNNFYTFVFPYDEWYFVFLYVFICFAFKYYIFSFKI